MGSEHYCLRWNNHQSNLLGVFSQLLRDESLVDVTLACSEGHSIRAHKVVLSACSSYFQTLFVDHPSRHPIVILKDVRFSELRTLVEFMYKGEVNVEYCQLSALLKTAESLKVKGLAEMTNLSSTKDDDEHHQQQQQQQQQHQEQTPQPSSQTINLSHNAASSDMDTESEQTEPTELVNKRLKEDTNSTANESPPPAPLSLRRRSDPQPKNENDSRPHSTESIRPDSPESDVNSTPHTSCGPNDMSMNSTSTTNNNNNNSISNNNNNNNATVTSCSATLPGGLIGSAPLCNRLPSPHSTEPVAGPSGMPPIQQVPLSLKKEVDWSSTSYGEEKGECSSEYRHSQHESMALELERCFGSPLVEHPSTTSAHSSRSSTPFAFPFPTFSGSGSNLDETSTRLLGLLHPALLGTTAAAAAAAAACAAAASATASAEDAANFRCPVCLAAFPSLWLLEQHTALQHLALGHFGGEDKPFVCDQCGQSYRYRSAYIKHREQNHRARLPADKLFSCDVCGMQFRYLKSFKKHRLNHALERLHGKTDILVNTDSGHVSNNYDSDAQHTENGNTSTSSNKEDTATESGSNQVSSSSNEATTTTDPTIPQITIKKEVTYPDDGTENMSTDSEKITNARTDLDQDDTIDSIAFSLTGVGSSNSNLESRTAQEASILSFLRMDAVERQRERRFACPFCGKCVRSKENLKLHVRKHTGERPFVCLFCGRAFGGKSDLTRHLRIHTGERPYHCEMCGKCFARADYLSKHLTTHIHTPR